MVRGGVLLTMEAVVPEIVSGSQMYVEEERSDESQRSPIYITTPPMLTTAVVCELYVLLPEVANVFQEDQGPLSEVAVQ